MSIQAFFSPPVEPDPGEVAVSRPKAFEAAHAYRDPSFGHARRVHGHNYVLVATIAGPIDPDTGFLVDFRELDRVLADTVRPLDHRRLDIEYEPLAGKEASAEMLALALHGELVRALGQAIPRARLLNTRLAENERLWADHSGGAEVQLTRSYSFSAAHRLADPSRGDDENRKLYGKCANPHPHGHDYRVEVSVSGEPDARGVVADLAALDAAVSSRVLDAFDHRYLNAEVPPFDTIVPTAERIAERVWELLAPAVPGLSRIVIYETPRSAFAYLGPGR